MKTEKPWIIIFDLMYTNKKGYYLAVGFRIYKHSHVRGLRKIHLLQNPCKSVFIRVPTLYI